MIGSLIKKIVGSKNERELKEDPTPCSTDQRAGTKIQPLDAMTELRAKTASSKNGLRKGESLEKILPEAFAVVRETARRTLGRAPL